MGRVLLIDDDVELCDMLTEYLTAEGFSFRAVQDGNEGLAEAKSTDYDLIILDVMIPGKNGFDILRELRARSSTPVLMLTARDEDVDSIIGLELGADDYLGKPCNPRVLVARVRALLRRAELRSGDAGDRDGPEVLKVRDLEMHPGARTVVCRGAPVNLTSTEYSVLEVLVREAGNLVLKSALSDRALGRKLSPYDRSLDMHVSSIRRKLGPCEDGEERIKTIRGTGYQYVVR